MKRHKQFRMALRASLLERREQYPEMTDIDVEKALGALVDDSRRDRARRKQAERWAKMDIVLSQLRKPAPTPAEREAELQRMAQEQARRDEGFRRRQEERRQGEAAVKAQRKISQEIIRAGHRALAQKHHPDVGGSNADMVRLNKARDALLRSHS